MTEKCRYAIIMSVTCDGEVSERFKELVLKTSDSQEPWVRIPPSPPADPNKIAPVPLTLEMYSRGRRGAPAKGVGRETVARVQIPPSPPRIPHKQAVYAVFLFAVTHFITHFFCLWVKFDHRRLLVFERLNQALHPPRGHTPRMYPCFYCDQIRV